MPLRKTIFLTVLSVLFTAVFAGAQEQSDTDSLVRLNYGKTAELLEIDGQNIRKVIGPAEFLHNDTYMLCDTALWNIDTGIIDAMGNVSIIQEGTILTSDKMKYIVDENLAQFRGTLVELVDSARNVLRTSFLDYNTKDSIGVFDYGGSMRDKDGQLIESIQGRYDSKAKLFTFVDDVNMFTDSIFVKTSRLEYRSDLNFATFGRETDAWKEENMLSADAGWYDRDREIFFFRNNVHVMNDTQEGWSDSLYFYRNTMDVDMRGHAQVSDSSRNVSGLAGRIIYVDSLARVTMLKDPAVLGRMDQDEKIDTVYARADTIVYYTMRMCDISQSVIDASARRVEDLKGDPVGAYRAAAAEAARKAKEEAEQNDPNYRPPGMAALGEGGLAKEDEGSVSETDEDEDEDEYEDEDEDEDEEMENDEDEVEDEVNDFARDSLDFARDSLGLARDSLNMDRSPLGAGRDSLEVDRDSLKIARDTLRFMLDSLGYSLDSLGVLRDSLGVVVDSLGVGADSLLFVADEPTGPLDTTKVNFLWATGNIRMFREDMQMVCDSLEYCDLDSLTRLYNGTVIWNEITQQYSADSIMIVFRNGNMEKANLMSEAYIVIEEEKDLYFDQVKSVEAIAYFGSEGELSRFDALGSALGAFFLREEDVVATANKTDSKMLSAVFENGEINKVYYFDDVKSDAYPVVQLPKEEQTYKGFAWQPERRPDSPEAVTTRKARPSMRSEYKSHPRAAFDFTELYFPGYIPGIYLEIQKRDSLGRVRSAERRRNEAIREEFLADSLKKADLFNLIDSTTVIDDVAWADSLALADSLAKADKKVMREEKRQQKAEADSLSGGGGASAAQRVPTKEELKEAQRKLKAAEREAAAIAREEARQKKLEERDARWAVLDSLDAAKAAAKVEKSAEKQRQKKLKAFLKADAAWEVEEAILEKYVQRIEKKEAKKEERAALKAAKKKPSKKKVKAEGGDEAGEDEKYDVESEVDEEEVDEISEEISESDGGDNIFGY